MVSINCLQTVWGTCSNSEVPPMEDCGWPWLCPLRIHDHSCAPDIGRIGIKAFTLASIITIKFSGCLSTIMQASSSLARPTNPVCKGMETIYGTSFWTAGLTGVFTTSAKTQSGQGAWRCLELACQLRTKCHITNKVNDKHESGA